MYEYIVRFCYPHLSAVSCNYSYTHIYINRSTHTHTHARAKRRRSSRNTIPSLQYIHYVARHVHLPLPLPLHPLPLFPAPRPETLAPCLDTGRRAQKKKKKTRSSILSSFASPHHRSYSINLKRWFNTLFSVFCFLFLPSLGCVF